MSPVLDPFRTRRLTSPMASARRTEHNTLALRLASSLAVKGKWSSNDPLSRAGERYAVNFSPLKWFTAILRAGSQCLRAVSMLRSSQSKC
jgi:hypothetical protein